GAARIRLAQVGETRLAGGLVRLGRRDDLAVDRGPAWRQLDPEGPPRPPCDRRAEERPADAREGIEDELARLREELDEAGHEPRRLVRPAGPPDGVTQLGRVGGRPERLRAVQPLLAGELVQRVAGMRPATTVRL